MCLSCWSVSFFPQPHSCNLPLLSRALPSCFLLRASDGKPTCKVSVEDSSLVYECRGEEHKTFTVSAGDESKFVDFATASWRVTPICLIFRVQCVSSYASNAADKGHAAETPCNHFDWLCYECTYEQCQYTNDTLYLKHDLTSVLKSCLAVQVWAGLMCMHVDWADLQ